MAFPYLLYLSWIWLIVLTVSGIIFHINAYIYIYTHGWIYIPSITLHQHRPTTFGASRSQPSLRNTIYIYMVHCGSKSASGCQHVRVSIDGGSPIYGWFILENPMNKWMITGGYRHDLGTFISLPGSSQKGNGMEVQGVPLKPSGTKAVEPSQLLRGFEGAQILKAIEEPGGSHPHELSQGPKGTWRIIPLAKWLISNPG